MTVEGHWGPVLLNKSNVCSWMIWPGCLPLWHCLTSWGVPKYWRKSVNLGRSSSQNAVYDAFYEAPSCWSESRQIKNPGWKGRPTHFDGINVEGCWVPWWVLRNDIRNMTLIFYSTHFPGQSSWIKTRSGRCIFLISTHLWIMWMRQTESRLWLVKPGQMRYWLVGEDSRRQ